ncbi:MAG: hypothetical protein H0X62_08705 [Bacteroidetes bacterium]|nr:hypothetical protein [Bacteroidota bacterium]
MEKIYCFNTENCSYEEVEKPFMMHNFLLLALMFTSTIFFLLTCYYHSENEKTLDLAPGIAKNCYTEVESLKSELFRQRQNLQLMANQRYLMNNATLDGASAFINISRAQESQNQLTYK